MSEENLHEDESNLVEWFDGKLDEFHHWLKELRLQREKNIETLKTQELASFPEERKKDTGSAIARESLWRFWLLWAVVVLGWYFLFQTLSIVYLLATWLIVSMAVERFVLFFQQWMPRGLAMAITYLLLFVILISGIVLIIPFLVQQTADLITMTIDRASVLQSSIQDDGVRAMINESILPGRIKDSLIWFLDSTDVRDSMQQTLEDNISQIIGTGTTYIKNAWDFAVWLLTGTFSAMFKIFVVFMVAIFYTLEREKVIWVISSFSSTPAYMTSMLYRLYDKLGSWLVWQLLLSVAVWVLVAVWLNIIWRFWYDLPNKFTLSLIAGLTEFIPYVWPILWGLPALFVATLSFGFKGFLVTMLMYYIVQRLENNVLVPMIMSQTLWVSPLLIFVTMIMMGTLLGILWIIIAVPIAVIVQMIYTEYIKLPKTVIKKKSKNKNSSTKTSKKILATTEY